MEVYKVVRVDDGRLKSAVPRYYKVGRRPQAQLTYTPGKVTKPKFGKIFAFDTLFNAGDFKTNAVDEQIWLAEASEAAPIILIASDTTLACVRRFKAFWEGLPVERKMEAPRGTVVCPEITLIRRV